jgi:hypothetical protein
MGKSIHVTMVIIVLLFATLACQPIQSISSQGPAPDTGPASALPTSAPMILPTIIEATATNPPPELPNEPGQVFIDDFSNRDSGWSSEYTENADWDYYMGGYRVSVRTSETSAWTYIVDHEYENVRLVVDAKKIGGQENNHYGLICRSQDNADTYYAALISSTGHFGIYRRLQGGNLKAISREETSVVINQGFSLNLIEMSCVGSQISLTVNGVLLKEVYDRSIKSGTVGMLVMTDLTESNDILFDNFHLYLEE